MPYPQSTLKLVWGGACGPDIWRTTLDLVTPAINSLTDAQLNTVALRASGLFLASLWTPTLKPLNAPGVTYRQCDAYFYPVGSTTVLAQGTFGVAADQGSAGTAITPFRTSIVASKLTDFAGRSNRGRAYLPLTGAATISSVTGQWPQSTAQAVAIGYADLLTDLLSADWSDVGIPTKAPIVTSVTASVPGKPITSVRVDSLPDTQRRRTNQSVGTFIETRPVPLP